MIILLHIIPNNAEAVSNDPEYENRTHLRKQTSIMSNGNVRRHALHSFMMNRVWMGICLCLTLHKLIHFNYQLSCWGALNPTPDRAAWRRRLFYQSSKKEQLSAGVETHIWIYALWLCTRIITAELLLYGSTWLFRRNHTDKRRKCFALPLNIPFLDLTCTLFHLWGDFDESKYVNFSDSVCLKDYMKTVIMR